MLPCFGLGLYIYFTKRGNAKERYTKHLTTTAQAQEPIHLITFLSNFTRQHTNHPSLHNAYARHILDRINTYEYGFTNRESIYECFSSTTKEQTPLHCLITPPEAILLLYATLAQGNTAFTQCCISHFPITATGK